jgi:hypothetical protein
MELKKHLLFILLSQTVWCTQAQNFQWARNIGQNQNDNFASKIIADSQGNIYVLGSFYDEVDFDPGPGVYNLSSDNGSSSIFILKLDSTSQFIWAKAIGGSFGATGYSMSLDPDGNLYVAGSYNDMVDFDPGVDTYFLTEVPDQNNYSDSFIMKLDASGNFSWAKSFGGIQSDSVKALTTDDQNNVYAIGTFMQTMDIDPGDGVHEVSPNGTIDSFVMKLDTDGNQQWAETYGSTFLTEAYSIALDNEANLYIIGSYTETVDFNTGSDVYELTSAGSNSAYILKLDSAGVFGWVKEFGGADASVYGGHIILDNTGNIYTGGSFVGSADFDPAEPMQVITASTNNAFVTKLDATGNFIWATTTQGDGYCGVNGIALNGENELFLTGAFDDTVDFDGGSGVANQVAYGYDIYMMKMATVDGGFLWVSSAGNNAMDIGGDVCADSWGNIYSTGAFYHAVDFDLGVGIHNLYASNYRDCYISKMGVCSPLFPVGPIEGPLSACQGSTSAVYNCGWATGASSIEWTVPDDYLIISGQNTTSIHVAFGSSPGNISVLANNSCYGYTSNFLEVVAMPVPYLIQQPTEQTVLIGDTALFTVEASSSESTFQWYYYYSLWSITELNDNAYFNGATSDSLSFTNFTIGNNNMNFFCIVSIGECSDTSDAAILHVLPTNVDNMQGAAPVTLFPNPTSDAITIQSGNNLIGMSYTVSDNMGRQLITGKINSNATAVDLGKLEAGLYIVQIGLDKKNRLKVVKG